MQVNDFIASIALFGQLTPRERIHAFAWHLHSNEGMEVFENSHIRECFKEAHLVAPDVSVYLSADGR